MKNRIMIVRGENEPISPAHTQKLYRFLQLTRGNYRNAVYVECSCGSEYMMVADQNGKMILFSFQLFHTLTGEYPQKDEMYGHLSHQAFENMYYAWLLWNVDETQCPVCSVYKSMKAEVL